MRAYKILVSESQPLVSVDAETAHVDSDGKLTLGTREGTKVAVFATWLYFIDVTPSSTNSSPILSSISTSGEICPPAPVISVMDHPFLSVGG